MKIVEVMVGLPTIEDQYASLLKVADKEQKIKEERETVKGYSSWNEKMIANY